MRSTSSPRIVTRPFAFASSIESRGTSFAAGAFAIALAMPVSTGGMICAPFPQYAL